MNKLHLYTFETVNSINVKTTKFVISYNIEEVINAPILYIPYHINYPFITYGVRQNHDIFYEFMDSIYTLDINGAVKKSNICKVDWLSTCKVYNDLMDIKVIRSRNFNGLKDLLDLVMIDWNE